MRHLLKKHWFLLILALVAIVGSKWAFLFENYVQNVDKRLTVISIMFLNGLTLETARIVGSLKRPGQVALGVLFGYFFAAMFGYIASQVFARHSPFHHTDIAVGICVISAMPTTLASNIIWTRMSGGNDAFSLVMTVVSNAVAFLVSPAILAITVGQSVSMDARDMMQKLFAVVVLPVAVAQVLRLVPRIGRAASAKKVLLSALAQLLVMNIILVGIVEGALELHNQGSKPSLALLALLGVTVVGVHLLVAFACWLTGKALRWEREDRLAFVFNGSQKTLPGSLYVCAEFFPTFALAPIPCVMYHVCQLITDSGLVEIARGREKRALKRTDVIGDPIGD